MGLPKWVVKWVKDNFNIEECELKVQRLEEENRKLRLENGRLRFYLLPKEESEWAINAFIMLTGHWYFSREMDEFMKSYVDSREISFRNLPFNDDEPLPF